MQGQQVHPPHCTFPPGPGEHVRMLFIDYRSAFNVAFKTTTGTLYSTAPSKTGYWTGHVPISINGTRVGRISIFRHPGLITPTSSQNQQHSPSGSWVSPVCWEDAWWTLGYSSATFTDTPSRVAWICVCECMCEFACVFIQFYPFLLHLKWECFAQLLFCTLLFK